MLAALALITVALSTPAQATRQPSAPPTPACSTADLQRAGVGPAQLKRLDELPPAQEHLLVMRKIGGCEVATIRQNGVTYYVPVSPRLGQRVPADHPGPAPATAVPRQAR
jgi:hypothetical protein